MDETEKTQTERDIESETAAEQRGREEDGDASPLLSSSGATDYRERWLNVQSRFVDEPRESVVKADELVAEVMDELSSRFADSRSRLESQWNSEEEISTEDLRRALQHYRSFFERLLAT